MVRVDEEKMVRLIRNLFSYIPTSVWVMAAAKEPGNFHACTVGSVAGISHFPPLFSVALQTESEMAQVLLRADVVPAISLSMLSANQAELADHFAGQKQVLRNVVETHLVVTQMGLPIVRDSQIALIVPPGSLVHDFGSHVMALLDPVGLHVFDDHAYTEQPLVYHRRQYKHLQPHGRPVVREEGSSSLVTEA